MKYLSTSELEKTYNVSRPTIGKWIEDAINKENNLQVNRVDKRVKIIENPHNREILSQLATSALKYKPKSEVKVVNPSPELYELYSDDEISDIYLSLLYRKEIDLKYLYKGTGHLAWNNYYFSEANDIKRKCNELLTRLFNDFECLIPPSMKVNLVDLGPGTGEPIIPAVKYFSDRGMINKYLSVDISQQILNFSTNFIKERFPDLETKSYQKDFEVSQFSEILLSNKSIKNKDINIIYFFGNTIDNLNDRHTVLKNLVRSCTKDDYLLITFTTDSPLNRAKVSYVKEGPSVNSWEWLLRLVGIEFDEKRLEGNYNSVLQRNELYYNLETDYVIHFEFANQKTELTLLKNEQINVWRHYLLNLGNILEESNKAGLELIEYKLDTSGTVAAALFKKVTTKNEYV